MTIDMLTSRRFWRKFCSNLVVSFGLVASVPQLILTLWPQSELPRGVTLASIAFISIASSIALSLPRRSTTREFDRPQMVIEVKVGNLFDEESHLVIGFNDVFDTDSSDGVIISPRSVQGQFQSRIYGGDTGRLNSDLEGALSGASITTIESRQDKPRGKLSRYEIGTVAALGGPDRRYFCLAYGRMRNDLTVRSSTDDLWKSLESLWRSLDRLGQREPVAMPIIGSEMARINHLDREVLLRMILMSYVAYSRQSLVSKKLTVLIHPKDAHLVNMLEVEAFLHVL